MINNTLKQKLKEKILILDGGFGTSVLNKNITDSDLTPDGFEIKGSNDILNLTRPETVEEIHIEFLEAGADIIETNTFNANAVSLADYHMESLVREINLAGAGIAKKAASKYGALVAGSVGPTNKSASIPTDFTDSSKRAIEPEALLEAYTEQIDALYDGGCDIIIIETIFDGLNAKLALEAACRVFRRKGKDLPVMISTTVNEGGRLLSGQTTEALFAAVNMPQVVSFGLNCSFGVEKMEKFIRDINQFSNKYISFYPNAGLPDENGNYNDSPEYMAEKVKALAAEGLINIAGGCCGTTPKHIKALSQALKGISPRTLNGQTYSSVSGLFTVKNDEIKIYKTEDSADFKEYADEGDYDTAFDMITDELDDFSALEFDADREDVQKIILTAASRPDISSKVFVIKGSDARKIISCERCAQGRQAAIYTGSENSDVQMLRDSGMLIL